MRMEGKEKRIILIVALALILLSGIKCSMDEDNPAPGCNQFLGLPSMGGCFGKNAIINLTVEPEINGIEIAVNNCNGGVLEVTNGSNFPLMLGGIEIAPEEVNIILDVLCDENGNPLLKRSTANYSEYIPEEDMYAEINGKLGTQDILITFTKTKKLCE
jgi:hypothetical protein